MVELDEAVIDEADRRGEALHVADLVALVELRHDDGRPGVDRDVLAAYADELSARADFSFDADEFRATVDDRLTDAETWAGRDVLYEVEPGRVSRYPARWHERLDGSTDVREYVEFLETADPEFVDEFAGTGRGVPEDVLLDVVSVLGGVAREEARAALKEARDRGDVVEGADQHPNAEVYLADDVEEDMRDPSLDG